MATDITHQVRPVTLTRLHLGSTENEQHTQKPFFTEVRLKPAHTSLHRTNMDERKAAQQCPLPPEKGGGGGRVYKRG